MRKAHGQKSADRGYTYDAARNLTGDGTNTYQWDAEGHLSKAINGGSVTISNNTYNALGQRARDVTNTSTKDEVYGADGVLTYITYGGGTSDRAIIPLGGRTITEYFPSEAFFTHPDGLGSLTTATDYTGNNTNERLFYPFGEFWTGAALPGLGMCQVFAQLPDYDSETDQYNTLNRHYTPMGRWMSPDPGGLKMVNLSDPQTWNLYAYVRNNPTTLTDPSGEGPNPPPACSTEECTANNEVTQDNPGPPPTQNKDAQTQKGVAAAQTYKTPDAAAKAAEKAALAATDKSGRKYEYGGWILKNSEGLYTYTIAVTSKDSEVFHTGDVTIPTGFTAVADYHTHPHSSAAEGEGLSAGDEQHAYDNRRTVYEADTYSRNMYRFAPGVSHYVPNEWCCGAIGDFVAHIP